VKRSIRIWVSEGSDRYELSFEDDDTAVELDFVISTDAHPSRTKRYRAKRASIMRKVVSGTDETIDPIVREFLHGSG
jgi:hypothetical protein